MKCEVPQGFQKVFYCLKQTIKLKLNTNKHKNVIKTRFMYIQK